MPAKPSRQSASSLAALTAHTPMSWNTLKMLGLIAAGTPALLAIDPHLAACGAALVTLGLALEGYLAFERRAASSDR